MASPAAASPVVPDVASPAGRGWRRPPTVPFEWISSSPSPAEIAELERLFPEIIEIPAHSLEAESAAWEKSSLLVRSLSRWVPSEAFVRELRRAGVPGEIEAINLSHKHFILRFQDPQARESVLHRPWTVNGQPMAIAEWESEFNPGKNTLLSALLWIRLPLLPLDFWSDEILSSILSAAGDFQYADEATKMKNRGGFARACVRVDVGSPLRPGARIRGSKEPFWQQFSYESVEGICSSCASLHLAGPCSAESVSSPAQVPPRFGSWMAAVRRRKQPVEPQSNPRSSAQAEESQAPASKDGWQLPKKWARRKGTGARAAAQTSPDSPHASSRASEGTVPPCQSRGNVPFSESNLSKGVQITSDPQSSTEAPLSVNIQTCAKGFNPFSALCADSESGPSDCCLDSNPVTSKRGRPAESKLHKSAPKGAKLRGKAPRGGKDKGSVSFSFSANGDSVKGGPGVQTCWGAKKLHGLSEPSPGSSSEVPAIKQGFTIKGPEASLPPAASGMDHGSAVSLLKTALQLQGSAMALDPAPVVCQGEGGSSDRSIGGPLAKGDHVVREMHGDVVDVPNTQSNE